MKLSKADKELGRALMNVLNAVYEVKVGKKTTALAITHIHAALKSCKNGQELFRKLRIESGESRSKAIACEMVGKFITLAMLASKKR